MPCIECLLGMLLVSFGLVLSSIVLVNTCTQNYYSLIRWPPPTLLLLMLGQQVYTGSSPVTTDDASCFNASRLSINTSAADFPQYTLGSAFFQKAAAVVLMVRGTKAGSVYTRQKNIRANTPSLLLPQSSMPAKQGGVFSGTYGIFIASNCNISALRLKELQELKH